MFNLCNGDFSSYNKNEATKFSEDKAKRYRDAFNTLSKRLNVSIESLEDGEDK